MGEKYTHKNEYFCEHNYIYTKISIDMNRDCAVAQLFRYAC